jgi:hypothetical protein
MKNPDVTRITGVTDTSIFFAMNINELRNARRMTRPPAASLRERMLSDSTAQS